MDQIQQSYLGFEQRQRRSEESKRDFIATDVPADYEEQMAAVPQLAYGLRMLILAAVTLASAAVLGGLAYGAWRLLRMVLGA